MRIACWVPKATNTHSEYVILIPFPLQRPLQERASVLRYTHISRLVTISFLIYYLLETLSVDYVQGGTKKRELLKNPTKIEEIQEKKIIDRN